MPTTIPFQGQNRVTPGSYVRVNNNALGAQGAPLAGVVALIGDVEGSAPVSAIDSGEDLLVVRRPSDARRLLRSGPVLEAALMAMNPSTDPRIPAGASAVVVCKTNPATRSSAQVSNGLGDIMTLRSRDYGAFTSRTAFEIAPAGAGLTGYRLTSVFEDETFSEDGVGGDPVLTLAYEASPNTFDRVTVSVASSGVVSASGTKDVTGFAAETENTYTGGNNAVVNATSADFGRRIRIYGLLGSTPTFEDIEIEATSQSSTLAFDDVFGAELDDDAAAAITVTDGPDCPRRT